MKKIPTLFERTFENHKVVDVEPIIHPGMEWVLKGEGIATVKWDGACCAIINGELFKRYDAKKGKIPPKGSIPCCDPDPVTKHWPHWVKCDPNNPSDKWFFSAKDNTKLYPSDKEIVTYEAIGKHFNGNPYNFDTDLLVKHGEDIVYLERSFSGIRDFLRVNPIEGLVFWKDEEPKCKIKRSDFGFDWPVSNNK